MKISFLSEEQINTIHAETLTLLQNTGVFFWKSPIAVQMLKSAGCRINEGRVFFPPDLVEQCIAAIPDRSSLSLYSPDGNQSISLAKSAVNFATIGNAYYIYDYDRKQARDAEERDVDRYWLLFENLKNIEVRVGELILKSWRQKGQKEISARCTTVDEAIACFQDLHYRKKVITKPVITSIGRTREQVRLGILQSLIYRSSLDDLVQRPTNVVWVNPLSPLQYDDQTEGIIEGALQGIPIMLSPEIMGGSTGPITLSGILLQQNAEILAGLVLAQTARAGSTVIYGSLSGPMDPRVADITLGSIEAYMVQCASVQMADNYGLPSRIAAGNTSTNVPGTRAMTEAVMGISLAAAAGANIITTGLLDGTLMLSYEHMQVLDEIIGALKRQMAGICVDKDHLAADVIHQEGKPGGSYLTAEHTMGYLRKELFISEYMGRAKDSHQDWYDRAHDRVRELFDQSPDIAFPPEIKDRAAAVEARIREDNQSWRKNSPDWWRSYISR